MGVAQQLGAANAVEAVKRNGIFHLDFLNKLSFCSSLHFKLKSLFPRR
jgi:hypothetical protein